MVTAKRPGPIGISESEPLVFRSVGIVSNDVDTGSNEQGVRGPIGMYPTGPRYIGPGAGTKQRKGGVKSGNLLKMKVVIIESPTQRYFKAGDSAKIVKSVNSELSRISKEFTNAHANFDVSWTQPRSRPKSAATSKILNVFIIKNTVASINGAVETARHSLPNDKIDGQEIANHVANDGGFNIKGKGGKTSVSFVSTTKLEKLQDSSLSGNIILANMILHEIGHGMGAKHVDKGLMETTTVYGSIENKVGKFTEASILKIGNFLSTL